MKRFIKKFEDIISESAFVTVGELKTTGDIRTDGKRILLAIKGGHLDEKILRYTLNTCKRVVANLDILYVSSFDEVEPMLEEFLSEFEKEGVDYKLIRMTDETDSLEKAIREYTDSHEEIVFAIIECPDRMLDKDNKAKDRGLSALSRNLKCPLVVVTEK